MSQAHLDELERVLAKQGWRIVAAHSGDDYRVSATWELRRGNSDECVLIDFEGMGPDGDNCLPIEESYGCNRRGDRNASLYFRRFNRSHDQWSQEVEDFVRTLG